MHHRKLQLVAGTTYTISLPKSWIDKNKLKVKDELQIIERSDRSLLITTSPELSMDRQKISLDIDSINQNINRALLELYYLGYESIEFFSKNKISKETRQSIRRVVNNLSGTEIIDETDQKVILKIIIDKTKIDLHQTLYRMTLIINQTLNQFQDKLDLEEIILNEAEVDRLYHLATKIISLAAVNSSLLNTSQIKHAGLLTNYLIIAKKLENIGDELTRLGKQPINLKKNHSEIITTIQHELNRTIRHLLADFPSLLEMIKETTVNSLKEKIEKIADPETRGHFKLILRYCRDIEEEIVSISFFKKLLREGKI